MINNKMRWIHLLKWLFIVVLFSIGLIGAVYFVKLQPTLFLGKISNITLIVVKVALVVSIAFFVIRLIDVIYWQWLFVLHSGKNPPQLLKDLVKFIIFVFIIFLIMTSILNISLTGYLATSGIIGLILGLALKNVLADLFNGIILHLDSPFSVGEYIFLHDNSLNFSASVLEVTWRSTRLLADDGMIYFVPNQKMCAMPLSNFSKNKLRHIHMQITLNPDFPAQRALTILTAAARSVKEVSHHKPARTLIKNITEEGIIYLIEFYCHPDPLVIDRVKSDILEIVSQHLELAGIDVGMPQQLHYLQEYTKVEYDAQSSLLDLLAMNALFADLTPEQHRLIRSHIVTHVFEDQNVILQQGDEGSSMFIIAEGLVNVTITISDHPEPISVSKLVMGDFFGEMSLFTGAPRSATIIAETEVLLYEVPKQAMLILFAESPQLMEKFAEIIAARQMNNENLFEKIHLQQGAGGKLNFVQSIIEKMRAFFYNA